jgi:hypothetical protein
MGQKKKLGKIASVVESILGDPVRTKKLKKAKALRSFITKMESKRHELSKELESDKLDKDSRSRLERHVETLDKQIKKANKIIDDMK